MRGAARRARRAAAVLLLVPALSGVSGALADSANPSADATNWYWAEDSLSANGTTLPVAPPAQSSGVPDGDLGVGYVADQAGSADKAAAVNFDLSAIPAGSTFSSFKVTVPYDPAAHQVASGTPDISACENIASFSDAPGPSPMTDLPPISLPSCVKGVFDTKAGTAGGYTFDLTAMANDWSGGAPTNGILIEPTQLLATPQQPFSLSFLAKKGITTSAEYTLPPQQVQQPAGTGTTPVVAPPAPLPAVQPVVPPVSVPQPSVAPAPAPQVSQATAPVAQATPYRPGTLVPTTPWWLAAIALFALLGLTAVVLGDPLAPAATDPRRRRFAEAVRARTPIPASATGRHGRTARFRPA